MKKIIYFLSVAVIFISACENKKSLVNFDAKFFEGNWTYRSLNNYSIDTPFCHLEFATAVMKFTRVTNDSIFGILDMGDSFALDLKGIINRNSNTTSFEIQGMGIPPNTENWEYDYRGFVVTKWENGINQVDACVGSVLRAKPHGQSKAGKTASFYMVRQ